MQLLHVLVKSGGREAESTTGAAPESNASVAWQIQAADGKKMYSESQLFHAAAKKNPPQVAPQRIIS